MYIFLIFLADLLIFFKVYKNKITKLYRPVNILGFFIILQIVLGIFTVVLGAQIYIAAVHQVSSIFLVTSSIYFFFINTRTS